MLPMPDAPPNFLAIAVQARRLGQEDRKAQARDSALSMMATNPEGAKNALMAAGDFETANAVDQQLQQQTRKKVFGQYATSPAGAQTSALQSGDPALIDAVSKLDQNQRAIAKQHAETFASVGLKLLQSVPGDDPQAIAQRKAALQAMKGSFVQRGLLTPDQVDNFEPTTANINAVVGQAMSLSDLLKQNEPFTLGPGQTRFGPDGKTVASVAEKPTYQKVGPGESIVQLGGEASGATQPAGSRAARNNNPGNVEDGKFAQSMPGYKGTDGRFAIFDSPEAGRNAQVALLQSYGKKGINTISGIVSRWAPASDNNPTPKYIAAVSKTLGLPPDAPLDLTDPKTAGAVADAMAQFEASGSSASNATGARVVATGGPKPQFRAATADEKAAAGISAKTPAQIGPDGEIHVLKSDETDVKQQQQAKEQLAEAQNLLPQIDDLMNRVKKNPGVVGIVGGNLGWIRGAEPYNVARVVDTIKANLAFDKLQAMRAASPTGGALGQVSNMEERLLMSSVASLDTGQSPKDFMKNLQIVRDHFAKFIASLQPQAGSGAGKPLGQGQGWKVLSVE